MKSLIIILLTTKLTVAAKCSLCEFGSIGEPDSEIPMLNIPGPTPTTCAVVSDYALLLDTEDPVCDILRDQAAFCGCTNETKPSVENACSLCYDGSLPSTPERRTPYGESCQTLNNYLSFLTKDRCQTSTHAKTLLDSAFGCGCQGATATCPMCEDGTIDIAHPNKYVPFLTLDGDKTEPVAYNNPTCEELAFFGSTADPDSKMCHIVKTQAGFCGCSNVTPKNECFFCPEGDKPENLNLQLDTGDTCQDIADYMSFLDIDQCKSEQVEDMRALGFTCGCKNTIPHCTLCPYASDTFDPDIVPDASGRTCLEIALSIAGLPHAACQEQRKSLTEIAAARCGCQGADFPVCPVQQNPTNCTEELLSKAPENCECYSFCDGEFVRCSNYPGGLLNPQTCPQYPVAGCNHAMVEANKIFSPAFRMSTMPFFAWLLGYTFVVIIAFGPV